MIPLQGMSGVPDLLLVVVVVVALVVEKFIILSIWALFKSLKHVQTVWVHYCMVYT